MLQLMNLYHTDFQLLLAQHQVSSTCHALQALVRMLLACKHGFMPSTAAQLGLLACRQPQVFAQA